MACLVLLFTANCASSQIYVFYDVKTNKFTEKNDYHQEGSDLWVGVGVNGLVLNETNLIDTQKQFSSFGCAQYQLSDTTFTIYLWLDYYYGSDCLCTENDNSCKADTSNCDLKIRFYSTKKGLSCDVGKIAIKNINVEKMAELSSYICSEDYLNLTKKYSDSDSLKHNKSIDFTYENLDRYLELTTYSIGIKNSDGCLKYSNNIKFILDSKKAKKHDEYLYYEQYTNYVDLMVNTLFPLQGKTYNGNRLKRNMKKLSSLSVR